MNVDLQPGKYVVAVSGGVDSVVLLHMLAKLQSASGHVGKLASKVETTRKLTYLPAYQLIVAHFDHGIRPDSAEDRKLVQQLAADYGLEFVYEEGRLGATASEAAARKARYEYLHTVRQEQGAEAIITAHHQDDVLETAVLNMLRGTGRRGLSSLQSTKLVQRPLLQVSKKQILEYADIHTIQWREDSTNADEKFLRNYVRLQIVPRLGEAGRRELLAIIQNAAELNTAIHAELLQYLALHPQPALLDRTKFIMLPHLVAREVMGEWLHTKSDVELSRKLLERLVIAAKTGTPDSKFDIDARYWLKVSRSNLALELRER